MHWSYCSLVQSHRHMVCTTAMCQELLKSCDTFRHLAAEAQLRDFVKSKFAVVSEKHIQEKMKNPNFFLGVSYSRPGIGSCHLSKLLRIMSGNSLPLLIPQVFNICYNDSPTRHITQPFLCTVMVVFIIRDVHVIRFTCKWLSARLQYLHC